MFLFIPLIYMVFSRQFAKVYYLVVAWTAVATASGLWGLVQFALKYEHAKQTGQDFYLAYLGRRITGFESHWMTFGALQLSVFSVVLANLFFSNRKMPAWAYGSLAILSAAILLGWTRSIWLATIPAVIYLVSFWHAKMVLAIPVVLVALLLIAPASTRDRVRSLFQPHGDTDSNRHRVVTFRTGVQMIKAHPWFGSGRKKSRAILTPTFRRISSAPCPPVTTATCIIFMCSTPLSAAFPGCSSSWPLLEWPFGITSREFFA